MDAAAAIVAKQQVQMLREFVRRLEAEAATEREAEARTAAKARVLAIKRADGALAAEEEDDAKRVAEAREAIKRLNDRYAKRVVLRAEADALAERFGLEAPALPDVLPGRTYRDQQ
jgi:hypothetical protein